MEARLMYEFVSRSFEISETISFSSKIRRCASNLMLYKGPESAVAAGVMVVCACALWYYSFYANKLLVTNCKNDVLGCCNRGSDHS